MQPQIYPITQNTFSLNIKGTLRTFEGPVVMGILNLTHDSFFDGGKFFEIEPALLQVRKMVEEGALMIDIGASSSRPGSVPIDENIELSRLLPVIEAIAKHFPESILSVDTFRAKVAKQSVEAGAHIINDISAGDDDSEMLNTLGNLRVPYIAMHKKGSTQNMQENPEYENVTAEVCKYFGVKLGQFKTHGIHDVILDPGFGFGKTVSHNYQLLREMSAIKHICEKPILVGLSRKSMVTRVLNVKPSEALNGTTSLNTIALLHGANILRVHDVKEAMECVAIVQALSSS